MGPVIELILRQIDDYPRVHRARANLAIHAFAVPLFWLGLALLGRGLAVPSGRNLAAAAAAFAASIGLQGLGHGLEREQAQPFSGALNFLVRLTTESLVVVPRYVLRGGFARAWASGR